MRKLLFLLVPGVALVAVSLAPAWWVKGHEAITEAAAARLPEEVPAFFRGGGKAMANFAGDPDRWKNRDTQHLRSAEEPSHFIDLEELGGKSLPPTRFEAIRLIGSLGKVPNRVGLLPYAILEGYEKLACAFYDYRQEPNNPAVPMKCLVHAGTLAHYTGDAAMPLHTTVDYDGRHKDGQIIQKGIHAKIDAFPEKNKFTPEEICRDLRPRKIDDVWAHINAVIKESHGQIDRCYALDAAGAFDTPTDESRAFIMERCRSGAQLTLDIWYNAWLKSATLPPPY
jgi:hypothetical protein